MAQENIARRQARRVLNVGGNSKAIPLPTVYNGWEHVLLDIDPRGAPDIVCDARELSTLSAKEFDAVYCSHNLEHYYRHDVPKVLGGFIHVLKDDGFANIRVPDIGAVIKTVIEKNLDIDDFLYESPAGPILVRDVIYGYGIEIEQSGSDFYAHKTGFTAKSLRKILNECGFPYVFIGSGNLELNAVAFRTRPTDYAKRLFNIP